MNSFRKKGKPAKAQVIPPPAVEDAQQVAALNASATAFVLRDRTGQPRPFTINLALRSRLYHSWMPRLHPLAATSGCVAGKRSPETAVNDPPLISVEIGIKIPVKEVAAATALPLPDILDIEIEPFGPANQTFDAKNPVIYFDTQRGAQHTVVFSNISVKIKSKQKQKATDIAFVTASVWNESPSWHRITPTAPRASYTGGPNTSKIVGVALTLLLAKDKTINNSGLPPNLMELGSKLNLCCLCSTTTPSRQPKTPRSAAQCFNTTTTNKLNLRKPVRLHHRAAELTSYTYSSGVPLRRRAWAQSVGGRSLATADCWAIPIHRLRSARHSIDSTKFKLILIGMS
ncbi:hypothetical protein KQX54_012821 [Cotesia glomerata]|uniref:Uncharacterized protein n=1 Tax=Cotesia glomerata TaxID=32391 RepID=A0AAV7IEK2_COTGL|nr:hypothetical protein KQX54_012821 [Cotesia glomerata]